VSGWWLPMVMVVAVMPGADAVRAVLELPPPALELPPPPGPEPELLALELRLTLEELGAMVGAVYTDDLLDRVFSRFCIGK